jgi:ABC-type sulfate transport system substrate-binding protein
LNKIPGANKAAKSLSKARRAIDGKKRDLDKTLKYIDSTLATIEAEAEWRNKIKSGPYNDLVSFEKYTQNNLGLREQERLTPEQVDIITPCLAKHRNIALQF